MKGIAAAGLLIAIGGLLAGCGGSESVDYTPASAAQALAENDLPCEKPYTRTYELECQSGYSDYHYFRFQGDRSDAEWAAELCDIQGEGQIVFGGSWYGINLDGLLDAPTVQKALGGEILTVDEACNRSS